MSHDAKRKKSPTFPATKSVLRKPAMGPENSGEAKQVEAALDEALKESFPASDPVAIDVRGARQKDDQHKPDQ
jgi:hypothetical protein